MITKNIRLTPLVLMLGALTMQSQAAIRYVNNANLTPSAPYTSWATAASSIQPAVDAAVNGDTVLVTNGNYWLSAEISVTKNITVESVNGAAVTIINGQDSVRCFNLGNSACVISGFTVTKGRDLGSFPSAGGGIYCDSRIPVLNRCRIVDNFADQGGGIYGGTANNCLIVRNRVSDEGGGMYDGTAVNCTISDNSAYVEIGDGAGIAFSTAKNCIIYGNYPDNLYSSTASFTCGGLPGNGNVGFIPQFVNSTAGDYRLMSTSPVIGRGSLALVAGSTDVDGNPRVQYGTVDMGAHEFFELVNYVSPSGLNVWPYSSWATAATQIQTAAAVAVDGGTIYVADGTYLLSSEITVSADVLIESVNGPDVTIVDGLNTVRCFNLGNTASVVSGFTIRNGYAEFGDGGGILCSSATPVVTNCIISGCEATDLGGGMYSGTANDCTISGGLAFNGGGMDGGTANRCVISGNEARVGGGTSGTTANHCTISGNTASSWGGGMYGGTANNCLITGNVSGDLGGGIYFGNAKNCTVRGNEAFNQGGGVYDTLADSCVIWYNTAPSGNDIGYIFNEDIFNSCSPDLISGVNGNITTAPLFISGFRLAFNSPCIDTGDNTGVAATDRDGNPRTVNGTVDMGAYEYDASFSDSNSDGIPDAWGLQYFGSATGGLASANGDIDPADNGNEYIAGTDPTNSASFFSITNTAAIAEGFVLEWEAIAGRVYSVSWSDSLTNSFQTLETAIAYPQGSYTDTNHMAAAESFYQLSVQLAD